MSQAYPVVIQPIDITDIAPARPADLARIVDRLVADGRGLVLINGAGRADRADIDAAFWRGFDGSLAQGNAALIRFWALVDVMASRRLTYHFMSRGFAAIAPLLAAASTQRLNARLGFVPQRIVNGLVAPAVDRRPAEIPSREVPTRLVGEFAEAA